MTNPNDPAFLEHTELRNGSFFYHSKGLTKREYFAAMAMQGLLAMLSNSNPTTGGFYETTALESVRLADALIAELNKEKP